ncbi:hypothetical protein DM02DRAFT_697773 [Periconia macrospinosa]|uniref:Uncharacterized protein n=1 Tax=Periconia macrospinosa TaxID=97972 RepID=A0A2V1D4Q7_9PLEO|nr:hypothetical protein DM02DRAFT_697773 [Periconia macrospinosa]
MSSSTQPSFKNTSGQSKSLAIQKIGWQTPTMMILNYLAAALFAVGHYMYCQTINGKLVEHTISQSWNNALTVFFAQGFSITLAAAGTQAFTQILWWFLRRRTLAVSKIDALFRLNTSALYLYRVDLLRVAPALWYVFWASKTSTK